MHLMELEEWCNACTMSKTNDFTEPNIWKATREKFTRRYAYHYQKLTQDDFAKIMGVSLRTVKSRENPKVKRIARHESFALRFLATIENARLLDALKVIEAGQASCVFAL